jgi:hypothetical protein
VGRATIANSPSIMIRIFNDTSYNLNSPNFNNLSLH